MVAAVLGTLFGPLVANRYLTIKQLFVVGELAMGVELALVSIFNYLGLESCLLVCIMLFTFTYQSTLGSYFFVYLAQVGNETINSIGTFITWFTVLIISWLTPYLINNLGVTWTFTIFSICAFVAAVYFIIFQRST